MRGRLKSALGAARRGGGADRACTRVGADRRTAVAADPRARVRRPLRAVHRLAGDAGACDRHQRAAAPPLHGAERALEHPRRRLHDRHLHRRRPARATTPPPTPPSSCANAPRSRSTAPGRLVSVCVGLDRPVLAMLDPQNLNALATMPLPPRNLGGSLNIFSDFSGGGYFYLDEQDRAVVPTTTATSSMIGESKPPAAPAFSLVARLRRHRRRPPGRRARFGAPGLERADLVHLARGAGRGHRPQHRRRPGHAARRRGHLELVLGRRDRRRLRRLRPGALPLRRRARGRAGRQLARAPTRTPESTSRARATRARARPRR